MHRTHGGTATNTYGIWTAMRNRCLNPNNHHYADYGGRGITVCERWSLFENFLADVGERPAGRTLGRIDNNGPYCPDNCRWETWEQQNRNTRNTKLTDDAIPNIKAMQRGGSSQAQIAQRLGVHPSTISRVLAQKTWR